MKRWALVVSVLALASLIIGPDLFFGDRIGTFYFYVVLAVLVVVLIIAVALGLAERKESKKRNLNQKLLSNVLSQPQRTPLPFQQRKLPKTHES